MTNTSSSKRTNWQISLLGGHKQRGGTAADTVVVTPIGGADVDLTDAELAPETTLTKVSLIGGVKLRVPADADVEIEGYHLFGGHKAAPITTRPTPGCRTWPLPRHGRSGSKGAALGPGVVPGRAGFTRCLGGGVRPVSTALNDG